jgi:hypothetical protein
MPDPSTIPAAKAALLAAIQARSALATAYVAWAGPTAPSQIAQPDRVYLTDTIDISRVWSGIGQQRIVETYTLVVVAESVQAGDDPQGTELRMWGLLNEVEQAVRADVTLASTIRRGALSGDIPNPQMGPGDDDHWIARAFLHVDCEAVI